MDNENTVGFAMGRVERFLEACARVTNEGLKQPATEALEYYRKLEAKFREWRQENGDLRDEVARLNDEVQKAQASLAAEKGKFSAMDARPASSLVSLDFSDEGDICEVWVHPEDSEPFGCGVAYLNRAMQVELETPPFKIGLTMPYLRAVYRMLEDNAHRLPIGRSPSL